MSVVLSAGPPIEPESSAVGHSSTLLVDTARHDRFLGIDWWYPAVGGEHPESRYEVLPGIGFTASALADAPAAPGPHPLVVWSHGRTGTRSSYVMLCEGLAARGYVVVAPDHPGDTLADWLAGEAVDDATNESQRVDDVRCVLDAALGDRAWLVPMPEIDAGRVAVAGHSYGAYTALALAGADRTDPRVCAVAGLQSFTRTLPRIVLARVEVPSLLVAGARDTITPPDTDADRAFAALASQDARRVDVEHAGHQACSDVGLYLEFAPQIEGLPELIGDFLHDLADQVTGRAGDPWRPTVRLHLRVLGAWLDEVLDRDREQARRDLDEVRQIPGVTMQQTGRD
jgi:predicted dienelactone hydrolase